ncbi:MAG: class I SAM-dependent methyltransferase [Patescibacteria group bacterium]|nr:class I SAM-dependent methyltransferase [Patescibacteria group bacterium]
MEKQVDASAYTFERYTPPDRWASFYYQLREIFAAHPASLLEVGPGMGIIRDVTRHAGVAYTSVDIAEDLHPDVVAPVTNLPFPDKAFDVVCAFEVLEHMPFSEFEPALAELARIARRAVLISLPHFGPSLRLEFKIPFLPRVRVAYKIPYPRRHTFNGQHYWEIGKRGYPVSKIRDSMRKQFLITKEFIPFENQYHHFFILEHREGKLI